MVSKTTTIGLVGLVQVSGKTYLESRSEKVYHHKRGVPGRRYGSSFLWRVKPHVETEIKHAEPHEEARPNEAPFASKCVGKESDEDGTACHLDNAINSRCKQTLCIACHTEVFEDCGCIVLGSC